MLSVFFLSVIAIGGCAQKDLKQNSVEASEVSDGDGFDQICEIFSRALDSGLSGEGRSNFINDAVENSVKSGPGKDTYYGIFNLSPEDRYEVFRQAANHYTESEWDCAPMKAISNEAY